MLLVSYDITDNKLRRKFSKYIARFGHRLQYSLYEIDNSERILDNIRTEIQNNFEKKFEETDSVLIIKMASTCTVERYGYARHDDEDMIII